MILQVLVAWGQLHADTIASGQGRTDSTRLRYFQGLGHQLGFIEPVYHRIVDGFLHPYHYKGKPHR